MNEWLWFLLPLAALSGWVGGYRAKKRKVERTQSATDYYKGLNYLLNHEPDRALDVFLRLAEVDSDTIDTHLTLASLFRRRGEVEKAIRIHQNLIARPILSNEQRGIALLELGKDYLSAGLFDRAESLFKELVEDKQQPSEASMSLLEIYQREQEWEKAIKIAQQLGRKEKDRASRMIAHFYCEMGEQAIRSGNYQHAIDYAKKAEASDRQGVRAKILLGDIAYQQNRMSAAAQYYKQVLIADPSHLAEVVSRLHPCAEDPKSGKQLSRDLSRWLKSLEKPPAAKGFAGFLAEFQDLDTAYMYLHNQFKQGSVTIALLCEWINFRLRYQQPELSDLEHIHQYLLALENSRSDYQCQHCGYSSRQHYWQCPSCKSWDTIRFGMPSTT